MKQVMIVLFVVGCIGSLVASSDRLDERSPLHFGYSAAAYIPLRTMTEISEYEFVQKNSFSLSFVSVFTAGAIKEEVFDPYRSYVDYAMDISGMLAGEFIFRKFIKPRLTRVDSFSLEYDSRNRTPVVAVGFMF